MPGTMQDRLYRMGAELVIEDPAVLRIVHGRYDDVDAAAGKGGFERRREAVHAFDPAALHVVSLGEGHEIWIAEGHTEIGIAVRFLLPADHPESVVFQYQHDETELKAVRRFQLLRIHHESTVAAHGEDAAIRVEHCGHDGRWQTGAHGRERVIQQQCVRDVRAIVAREPDLVHAVVEADDAVLRHRLAHIVHDALRRQWIAAFFRARGNVLEDSFAQGQQRARIRELALEALSEQLEAGADIADELDMREEHFLDGRRQISHMQYGGPLGPHEKGAS